MISSEDFENSARKYCEIMDFDPDEEVQFQEESVPRWRLAVEHLRAHLAAQLALQHVLSEKREPMPRIKSRIVKPN